MDYSLKIGILPIRRYIAEPPKRIGIFQSDYAVENKRELVPYIEKKFSDENTKFVNIDFLNEEGLLYLDDDCDKVISYFKEQKIDALIILNCNFGNEFVAGTVARALHLPTLLFGPRDTHFENGIRYTDTQCGLFAISKQLKRGNVPFEYIENCNVRDEKFTKGIKEFFSICSMVK
ncbi:MAG: fucose isomerase, partial [Clostridiales bacterium]|nr:fucose isomerase [Clostridiales bacterium]